MLISEGGRKLFKEWEGFERRRYLDSGGAWTIGIGHLITKSELTLGFIKIGNAIVNLDAELSEDEVWKLFNQDIKRFEKVVNERVTPALNQNQFDALVSFAYNVGVTAFEGSTLLKVLNQHHFDQVQHQLMRWIYDNGKVVKGLLNRRKKECLLWEGKS